jgi:hypothetical protein
VKKHSTPYEKYKQTNKNGTPLYSICIYIFETLTFQPIAVCMDERTPVPTLSMPIENTTKSLISICGSLKIGGGVPSNHLKCSMPTLRNNK